MRISSRFSVLEIASRCAVTVLSPRRRSMAPALDHQRENSLRAKELRSRPALDQGGGCHQNSGRTLVLFGPTASKRVVTYVSPAGEVLTSVVSRRDLEPVSANYRAAVLAEPGDSPQKKTRKLTTM